MISLNAALHIHDESIKSFGGSHGVRDLGALESALKRPFQTFGGEDLYPSPLEKASALLESVLKNHPFIDGNKRTGYVLMRVFLLQHNIDISASQEEKYKFVIQVASSEYNFEEILDWLHRNTSTP